MSFLPDDYSLPSTGNYLRLQQGDTRFRPCTEAIAGREFWSTEGDKRVPHRRRRGVPIAASELGVDADGRVERAKNFVAFGVLHDGQVMILQVTQSTIMGAIEALVRNPDWGDPVGSGGYDLMVTRQGSGLDTTYTVQPCPRKAWTADEQAVVDSTPLDLDKLYDNGDPFEAEASPERVVTAKPAAVRNMEVIADKSTTFTSQLNSNNERVYLLENTFGQFGTTDKAIATEAKAIFDAGELAISYDHRDGVNVITSVRDCATTVTPADDDIPF